MGDLLDQTFGGVVAGFRLMTVLGWAGILLFLGLLVLSWVGRSSRGAWVITVLVALALPIYGPHLMLLPFLLALFQDPEYPTSKFFLGAGIAMGPAWLLLLLSSFVAAWLLHGSLRRHSVERTLVEKPQTSIPKE